ncbi:MAG: MFS transporter [Pseudomonadota bacterium]
MADPQQHKTAPEDRVPVPQMIVYGMGAFVNNLLAGAIGGMMIVLNLGLGMNPALVGLLGAIPRFVDAITDPLMGYISDNTKSKWGRRRPYIFCGAIAVGIVFIALWQLPRGQSESFYFYYFLIGSLIFYVAYTIFATPWVALGYEMTPDYHERTRLMGVQNFIGQLAYFVPPWLLLAMQYEPLFGDMVEGAAGVAVVIGLFVIVVGVMPAIFLRERLKDIADKEHDAHHAEKRSFWAATKANVIDFVSGFAAALRFIPFLKLCIATFLIFNGFILISSFQIYVLIYYVFGGDQALGAQYAGYAGTVSTFSTFAVIAFITWLSTKIGKRKAFAISTSISMFGYFLKWFCYNPEIPMLVLLPAPFIAFGLGGLFTLMPSMMADVVDLDELKTGERREGMYGSIYWWVVKLGMAVALAGGGFLLNATGFDVALEGNQSEQTILLLRLFDAGIPVIASGFAIWAVNSFGITQSRAREVRQELEKIRGASAPLPA